MCVDVCGAITSCLGVHILKTKVNSLLAIYVGHILSIDFFVSKAIFLTTLRSRVDWDLILVINDHDQLFSKICHWLRSEWQAHFILHKAINNRRDNGNETHCTNETWLQDMWRVVCSEEDDPSRLGFVYTTPIIIISVYYLFAVQ